MQKFKFILILSALCTCFYSLAEIYKWKDENGVIQYSDVKPENTPVKTLNIQSYESAIIIDEEESEPSEQNSLKQKQRKYLTRPKKVIMYSTQWCGYCEKARKHFSKNNIAYTEYDIEKSQSAKRRYDKLGATGIPVIFVGKKRMNGFSVERFNLIYK